MTVFAIAGISEGIKVRNHPNSTFNDDPMLSVAGIAVISLPALYAGAYYGLVYKKKFDVQFRYDLMIIKQKEK